MISAKILADSVNGHCCRLTTFLITYPRFIHAEVMTHRVFSRNAASSRAIPFRKMADSTYDVPAWPEKWGAEQKGMNMGNEIATPTRAQIRLSRLLGIVYQGIVDLQGETGLHKSILNRYLEPWSHITTLLTGTDTGFANFFMLRANPNADATFQVLAYRMLHEYMQSRPEGKEWGEWHMPEFENAPWTHDPYINLRMAVARCARLSYLTHEGVYDPEADVAMHDRLRDNKHWSPFEHCAQAGEDNRRSNWDGTSLCGWEQYRKMFSDENCIVANHTELMAAKPDWIKVDAQP